MPHCTQAAKQYHIVVTEFIANVHVVLSACKESWENTGLTRKETIRKLKECFGITSDAAAENLLDGFYFIDEDGSVHVDDVTWGRR